MSVRRLGRGFGDLSDDDIFGDPEVLAEEEWADGDPDEEEFAPTAADAEDFGEGVFNVPDDGAWSYSGDPYPDGPGEFDSGSAGADLGGYHLAEINKNAIGGTLDESQATAAYQLGAERGMLDAMSNKPADPPLGLVPPTVQGSFASGYVDGYKSVKPTAAIGGSGSSGGTAKPKPSTGSGGGTAPGGEPLAEGMSTGAKVAIGGLVGVGIVGAIAIARKKRGR